MLKVIVVFIVATVSVVPAFVIYSILNEKYKNNKNESSKILLKSILYTIIFWAILMGIGFLIITIFKKEPKKLLTFLNIYFG